MLECTILQVEGSMVQDRCCPEPTAARATHVQELLQISPVKLSSCIKQISQPKHL